MVLLTMDPMEEKSVKDESNKEITKLHSNETAGTISFKKPLLIGKIGRLPRKITTEAIINEKNDQSETVIVAEEIDSEIIQDKTEKNDELASQHQSTGEQQLQYKEPNWSGLPENITTKYTFEVLKNGVIIETINLMTKSFWVFGRLPSCDITMAHPTISRYHAVLQYRKEPDEDNSTGFYIYDLSSTHGTFLNKNRIKPRIYVKVKVGHMIKLGCSTRNYILTGPEEDAEEESELTVTELKQKRVEELAKREEEEKQAKLKVEMEAEAKRKRDEERGIDWGMGEDAEDEDIDLTENPYAQTNNEEIYISDPKKALRGFMEREGYDLEYNCEEQGFGQFLCKVELPIDDEKGRPIVAEVLHKGKKKEAVVQCALEACRILDRYGVLRQATHESRKRKAKNWEEDDYYDSDEDTFLDRTGTIEKKREKRMKDKIPQKVETYESLIEKEKALDSQIADIEKQLQPERQDQESSKNSSSTSEEDPLDSFMNDLKKQSKLDKQTVSKLKSDLAKLKQEHSRVVTLANVVKPANLPPLITQQQQQQEQQKPHKEKTTSEKQQETRSTSQISILPTSAFGKRKKIQVQLSPQTQKVEDKNRNDDDELGEEGDEKEEEVQNKEEDGERGEENGKLGRSHDGPKIAC